MKKVMMKLSGMTCPSCLTKIEKAVDNYLVSSMWEHTRIAFAKNQNNAGMLGAFYHFQGRHQ